ncbi:MAG TPA: MFS transporter [Saprospiraceae bacterium]|nr:MFS transporter [Saprospiraceae bacterium]
MSDVKTAGKKVPFGQKVAFGVGMLANQMFPAILGIFMVVLVEDLRFTGLMWAAIFVAPRVFDAFTDPIMGFISDNTKSRWGRRRQYVMLGATLMGFAFIFMWQLYIDNSLSYNFWYFFLWSIVFYLGLTIFSVPYVAMGYEMTDDFHERTNIMAIAQWIGQWAWVIAPWFWVIMYDPEWFPSAEVATRSLAIWVGIPCAICAMVPAIFIKSESTLDKDYEPMNLRNIGGSFSKILDGFREAFKLRAFRKLCVTTFLIFGSFNTVAALTFFVIVYKLFDGDAGAAGVWVTLFGSLGALGTTFIVIPIVAWMAKKLGKKNAFLVCQTISIVGYTALYFLFVPGKPWLYIIALPFFSFGIGSLFTIMMSMTADILDVDELNTGLRREGTFGAIYWWMVKIGFALAGGLSGLAISVVGFDSTLATTEQQGAVDALHAFFCFFPVVGTLIAIWVMRDYDITEETANKVRAVLDRRKEQKKGSSAYLPGQLIKYKQNGMELDRAAGLDLTGKSIDELSALFTERLNSGLHGLCFSPYVEGQETGDILSETQIRRRMEIITPYTQWIRSFSCTEGNELIPKIAREKGLKTMVGAWISNDLERNEQEITALIELAEKGLVDIAVVGNEALMRDEISEAALIRYIKRVKKALPNTTVAYVDAYYQFLNRPGLINAVDQVLINCYPFWEGADNTYALNYLQQMYQLTELAAGGKKVIITETGWPSKGQAVLEAAPTEENAMKYFINIQQWAQEEEVDLFYFSSFDESWKIHQEGVVGTRWGLWDKSENLKYGKEKAKA